MLIVLKLKWNYTQVHKCIILVAKDPNPLHSNGSFEKGINCQERWNWANKAGNSGTKLWALKDHTLNTGDEQKHGSQAKVSV